MHCGVGPENENMKHLASRDGITNESSLEGKKRERFVMAGFL
jgi:hypothetical protein